MEGPCSCHITQQNIWQAGHSCFLDFNFKVADSSRAISRYVTQCTSSILYKSNLIYLANEEEIIALIRHLGTQSVRSRRLICLSRAYLQEPPSLYDLRSSKCAPRLPSLVLLKRILLRLSLTFQEPVDMRLIHTAFSALKNMVSTLSGKRSCLLTKN